MPIQTAIDSISQNQGSPFGFKNRIINGGMVIDQRNAGASVTGTGSNYNFPVDRFKFYNAQSSKLTGQRSSVAPDDFKNSLLLTSLAATTPGAGDEYQLYHVIEGHNVSDLNWGTSTAKPITLSFWVRSSLTGTFSGCINNGNSGGAFQTYVFSYTINQANTWEKETITIPGSTAGSWGTGTDGSIYILWDLGSGSNFSGTAGSWGTSFRTRTSGSVNLIGTNAATFYITGVQFEVGRQATSFDFRPYGTELQLCRRYLYQSTNYASSSFSYTQADFLTYGALCGAGTWMWAQTRLPVQMRVAPTITTSDQAGTTGKMSIFTSSGGSVVNNITPYSVYITNESYNVSVYNESKHGLFGAIRADAEL